MDSSHYRHEYQIKIQGDVTQLSIERVFLPIELINSNIDYVE